MEVVNKVVPSEDQLKGFTEPGHDGPIYMLNLLKFKDQAEYADGRQTELTGAEAYAIYGTEVVGHLAKVGGKPMFSASVERLMLGEVEELWDSAAIAMYPSRKAMMEMISSGLRRSRLKTTAFIMLGFMCISTHGLHLIPET